MVPDHSTFPLLIVGSSYMKQWRYRISVLLLVIVSSTCISDVQAQVPPHQHGSTEATVATVYPQEHISGHQEESPEGTDFSEFHHRVAGFFIVVFGLAELGNALQYPHRCGPGSFSLARSV